MFALLIGKKLVEQREHYYIKYTDVSVSGLEIGSNVKYHGLTIGRVEDIIIDEDNINNIIVKISVKKDVPIKKDVKAKLVSVGITGLKQIELTGGSSAADEVEPEGYIQAGTSYLENITGRAEVIANKTEYLVNNLTDLTNETNRENISSIINNLDTLVATFNRILLVNQDAINNTLSNLELASGKIVILADSSIEAINNLNTIARSKAIPQILANTEAITDSLTQIQYSQIREKGDSLYKTINQAVIDLNRTINNIDLTVLKSREDLIDAISSLEETSRILREFARKIKQDPTALLRSKNK